MSYNQFTILITTKNRIDDLKYTLHQLQDIFRDGVHFIICDDASNDGTSEFLKNSYPEITLISNSVSKGYLFNRNIMLNSVRTSYAISLDDDAHFVSKEALNTLFSYFKLNSTCGLIALRIFWGLQLPEHLKTTEKPRQVNGFVGCGHVWRMEAWNSFSDYPEWFEFYGEEQFAAFQMFKRHWEIHYVPETLIQHRVDMKERKNHKDYITRQHCSLRSGWYLMFLCYPLQIIPKRFVGSLWSQLKRKVFKGNLQALWVIFLALFDVIRHSPKFFTSKFRLSRHEFTLFNSLEESKIYWTPKHEK
ncbi:GT2 family glycosyltransferase [Gelidibacter algens]|uniref:GT2 family glycosyltransferase n=1 Tax=Gelidibacter algens TaxID=49280 RepID=A0A1A7QQ78_9FLAO|nr:glycosyltransferase [Gelidibacter algens]OBX21488.1 glycosyl transferase [Gelidibacter algens]RAJ25223.1 GT2 family glycosyltransferase [Gelidibacter algens]